MPETLTVTQTVNDIKSNPVQEETIQKSDESLLTRASKVSLEQTQKAAVSPEDSIKLDQATIDKIADPVLKQAVIDAKNSMQADYTRKTQELASKRKEMDTLKSQLESSGQYTPAKIQQLLSDPSFVQAAQEFQRINGGQTSQVSTNGELSAEEFSYLSPEQQKLYTATQDVKKTNDVILSKLNASETARAFAEQDAELSKKYGQHYKPDAVTQIYNDMMSGKLQATREHLFRVADYESYGERCYRLGQEDRKFEMGEKVAASSNTNGVSVTPSSDVPVRIANESGPEYFKRIALNNAAKFLRKQ